MSEMGMYTYSVHVAKYVEMHKMTCCEIFYIKTEKNVSL